MSKVKRSFFPAFRALISLQPPEGLIDQVKQVDKERLNDVEYFYCWLRFSLKKNEERFDEAMLLLSYVCENEKDLSLLIKHINWIDVNPNVSCAYRLAIIDFIFSKTSLSPLSVIKKMVAKLEKMGSINDLNELYAIARGVRDKRGYIKDYKTVAPYMVTLFTVIRDSLVSLLKESFIAEKLIKKERNKIFLLAGNYDNHLSTHFIASYNIAKSLVCCGFDVVIVVTGEMQVRTPFGWYQKKSDKAIEELISSVSYSNNGNEVKIYDLRQSRASHHSSYLNFLEVVSKEKPSAMLFIGAIHGSVVYKAAMYDYFPIGFLPMATNNRPGDCVDVVMATPNSVFHHLVKNVSNKKYKVVEFTPSFDEYLKSDKYQDFELESDKFLICTPLTGGRLNKALISLNADYIEAISTFLTKKKVYQWILVGELSLDMVFEKWPILRSLFEQGYIRSLPKTKNFLDLMKLMDVLYVIPTMTGSNQSVLNGIHVGTPAVVNGKCDSVGFVPNTCVYETIDESFCLIEKLKEDLDFKEKVINQSKDQLASFSVDNESSKIVRWKAIDTLHEVGYKRLGLK